jgi:hypothetical protein
MGGIVVAKRRIARLANTPYRRAMLRGVNMGEGRHDVLQEIKVLCFFLSRKKDLA